MNRLFFGSLSQRLTSLKSSLAIQAGQKFDRAVYNAARAQVRDVLANSDLTSREHVRVAIVVPAVEDCVSGGLTVIYRIFSTDAVYFLSNLVEFDPTKITQNMTPGATGFKGTRLIAPLMGYNPSRGFFGGGAASVKMSDGIFQKFNTLVSVSQGSAVVGLGFSGQHDFGTQVLDHAEWRLDYRYSDDPIDRAAIKLRAATLAAQFLASTRASVRGSVMGRYGAAIEGGNRQISLTSPLAFGEVGSASYGSVKGYVGATFAVGRDLGAASYGIQIGKAPNSTDVGYWKHLVDLKFKQRFLPRAHVPITFDSAFNAGWIESPSNQIPAVEAFYGGNVARDFVGGDSWKIQDGPRLRSFPQDGFNSTFPGGPFGATRFLSANFTFAASVRHYAAVPEEILQDPGLRSALSLQLSTTKEAFVNDCEARAKPFADVVVRLRALDPVLQEISGWLARLHALPLPDAAASLLSDADDNYQTLKEKTANVAAHPQSGASIPDARMMSSSDEDTSPILQVALSAEALAAGLSGTAFSAEAAPVSASAKKLRDAAALLGPVFAKVQQLNTADPARYRSVANELPRLRTALEGVKAPLDALGDVQDDDVAVARDAAQTYLDDSLRKLAAAETPGAPANLYDMLDTLLVDWGRVSPASPKSEEEQLRYMQAALRKAKLPERAQTLDGPIKALNAAISRITSQWRAIPRPPIQTCAFADAAFAIRTTDAAFRELNLFQISPVAIFDAARLSSPHAGSTGLRYGTGAGIRISLATLDVTAGYAFNVGRKPGESRGAFFFSLDVSDIFR